MESVLLSIPPRALIGATTLPTAAATPGLLGVLLSALSVVVDIVEVVGAAEAPVAASGGMVGDAILQ